MVVPSVRVDRGSSEHLLLSRIANSSKIVVEVL